MEKGYEKVINNISQCNFLFLSLKLEFYYAFYEVYTLLL